MTAVHEAEPAVPGSAPSQNGVWSLVLPGAESLLCRADTPPPFLGELARRGMRVDVVSRCAHESWNTSGLAGLDGVRCLWEPDRDADYDGALFWDPARGGDVRDWLLCLQSLRALPREVALWSRNPLHHPGAPHWWRVDGWLERRGWQAGAAYLGLPSPERVRQLVDWDAYTRTTLVRHRRSDQAWKSWMTRQPAWRWMQPARLRRASLRTVTPAPSVLDDVLADVARACNAVPYVERILASPNGVAIIIVHLLAATGARRAVLKIPYATAADARVARNAAGLEWIAAHSASLGRWSQAAPVLLARGTRQGWLWTLEEWVAGTDAQGWDTAAKDGATRFLGDYLAQLALLGQPARALDDAGLHALCGNALDAASALMPRALAERLRAVRHRLYEALRGVPVPVVPRHGDFKLENVLGDPSRLDTWRVLDWELWSPHGAPLLDAWHLVASRRAREAGCAMGSAVRRWLLAGELNAQERELVQRLAHGLDPRYVELSPVLYWLDRIGPVAARGGWPAPHWETTNVAQVLDALTLRTAEVGT